MKFYISLATLLAVSYATTFDVEELSAQLRKINEVVNSSEQMEETIRDAKIAAKDFARQMGNRICASLNGTEVYDAIMKVVQCKDSTKVDGLLCDIYASRFKKCIEPLEKVFEGCVEAKLHDIPQFIVDIVTSVSAHFCDTTIRAAVELGNPCIAKGEEKIKECLTPVSDIAKKMSAVTNLKTELCSGFKTAKQCVIDEVNRNCKHDVTKKSFADAYEAAVIKPCAA